MFKVFPRLTIAPFSLPSRVLFPEPGPAVLRPTFGIVHTVHFSALVVGIGACTHHQLNFSLVGYPHIGRFGSFVWLLPFLVVFLYTPCINTFLITHMDLYGAGWSLLRMN